VCSLFEFFRKFINLNWGFCPDIDDAYYVKVPTINQETAVGGSEPTETLMKVRSGKVLRPNSDKNKNKVRLILSHQIFNKCRFGLH